MAMVSTPRASSRSSTPTASPREGTLGESISQSVSRLVTLQQQHGIRLGHIESQPPDNSNKLDNMFDELRREVLESRKEILNSLRIKGQEPLYSSPSKNLGPALQSYEDFNVQLWQQDFREMKQTLDSIQQDIQSLKAQRSDRDSTGQSLPQKPEISSPGGNGNLAQQFQQHRNHLMSEHGTPQMWSSFDDEVKGYDSENTYQVILQQKIHGKGFWHMVLRWYDKEDLLPTAPPKNALADVTTSLWFTTCQALLILSNAVFMGFESHTDMKGVIAEPPEDPPEWMKTVNDVFNIIFLVELVYRIIALRAWFWVAGRDWGWNVFDVVLVGISIISDFLLTGVNITFIRMLRILRVVRVARAIRVMRVFRQLRQMLFSVIACLASLAWAFIFLLMVMFLFSILFLQGLTNTLKDMDLRSEDGRALREEIDEWFGSLDKAMLSLLAAVTGGMDWMVIKAPLDHAGWVYGAAFIVYLLFVTVGVMNVLTGVFLSNADDLFDLDLMGQCEQVRVESLIGQMIQLYNEIDVKHTGLITWDIFSAALANPNLKAFLASLKLEPTHVRLIFDLLDEKRTGQIAMSDFVMSMVKLRGEAKAIDARIIQREISMIPLLLGGMKFKEVAEPDIN